MYVCWSFSFDITCCLLLLVLIFFSYQTTLYSLLQDSGTVSIVFFYFYFYIFLMLVLFFSQFCPCTHYLSSWVWIDLPTVLGYSRCHYYLESRIVTQILIVFAKSRDYGAVNAHQFSLKIEPIFLGIFYFFVPDTRAYFSGNFLFFVSEKQNNLVVFFLFLIFFWSFGELGIVLYLQHSEFARRYSWFCSTQVSTLHCVSLIVFPDSFLDYSHLCCSLYILFLNSLYFASNYLKIYIPHS